MRRNKRWFGPKLFGIGVVPVSWEGWALTITVLLAMPLLQLEVDQDRRGVAMVLILVAYAAIAILTYGEERDSDARTLRETLFDRRTWVGLGLLLGFFALLIALNYACGWCYRTPVPGLHASPSRLR